MSTLVQGIPSLDEVAKQLAATPAQIDRAMARAVAAVTRWAGDAGRSGIARALDIRVSSLKGRTVVAIRLAKEGFDKAWFGLNDLDSSRLSPRQTADGATAQGLGDVPHAFVREVRGKKRIYIRRGTDRYPIDPVKFPFDQKAKEVVEGEVFPQVQGKFMEFFSIELNREVSK